MEAAFRTCGLHPIDKEQVLKRLPRTDQLTVSTNRLLLDQTFGERLENLRGVDKEKKKRGKKVPAGKSFTAVENSSSEEDDDEGLMVEDSMVRDSETEDSEEEVIQPKKIRASIETSSSESDMEAEAEAFPTAPASTANPSMRVLSTLDGGPDTGPSSSSKGKSVPCSKVTAKNTATGSRVGPTYAVGEFVIAMYDGLWYIGVVEGEDPEEEVEGFTLIQYFERKGDNRFVRSNKDLLKTLNSDILLTIDPPIPVSHRDFWGVPLNTLKIIEKLVKEWFLLFSWHFFIAFSNFKLIFLRFVISVLFFDLNFERKKLFFYPILQQF